MFLSNDVWIKNSGGRSERIHRRVNAFFRNGTLKRDRRIQVRKGCNRRGVRVIVGRHIHRLHGGDRARTSGSDTFLQLAHFGRESRLVSHCGRHTPQQRGHFRTGHRETEDIINEEQNIAALIAEILSHGEGCERHTQTNAGRLVHLAKDHDRIFHHARFEHFTIQLRTFASAFPYPRENRIALMFRRHRTDQFHDDHGLARTCTTEDAGLAALGEWGDQIDHLDSRFEYFHMGSLFRKRRRQAMDRIAGRGIHFTLFIHRVAEYVENAPEGGLSHRHENRRAGRGRGHATLHTVGGIHGYGANPVIPNVFLHLEDHFILSGSFDFDRFVKIRNFMYWEFHIHDSTQNLYDTAVRICHDLCASGINFQPARLRRLQYPKYRS